jgi:tyrosyl-tRNA synthetase
MIDNAEWLDRLEYIRFLRDIGRHFSVNRMLTMDSVKLRLEREQPMSFLEFNYMVMQAYDFVELYRRYGCRLQSAGSDQWGNIVSGIDLGRRVENVQLFGLTTPLITTASGAKMGKTAAGAVWLNADASEPAKSHYEYWQFWRNTEDRDVGRFLRLFTDLPMNEIARLESLQGSELNEAKRTLAVEATTILYGREAAQKAAETARQLFEEGRATTGLPTKTIDRGPKEEWTYGRSNTAIIVASGLATSNGDARRKIDQSGFRINGKLVTDPNAIVPWTDVEPETGAFRVQFGQKKTVLVKPV